MDDSIQSMTARTDPLPSAIELARRITVGETSALAVVEMSLTRIAALDDALCAFCSVTADPARREAQAVDRRIAAGEAVGPLAGVPFAVKDLISTSGVRTTFGSPLYADNVPDEDDIVVERLRAAGAIMVGKTNTSEFGYGPIGRNPLFPPTRNPWNTELTPGGSSAGSSVAVATGMVPLALGSDGGGSIRIPASLNGIFGIKPSWGRVPVYPGCRDEKAPGASGWETLEHIGPLTRTVADAAMALSVLSGPSPKDRHSLPHEQIDWMDIDAASAPGRRIAFSADLGFAHVDPEVAAIAAGAAQVFATELGCVVHDAFPEVGDTQATFEALVALDTDRAGLRTMADRQSYAFGGVLGTLLRTEWTADHFTNAIMDRKRIANVMWRFMARYDLLLTPTAATAAFPLDRDGPTSIAGYAVLPSAWTPFSALANLTGQPAASVPAGFTRDSRPVGLQIIGRHQDDIGVLRAAAAFERVRPWQHTWPAASHPRKTA
ncbi:aspartyl-tRNA(Asn)/glutamyl-tRNA(Gln) amidotransferase subunit A [Pararhizobium capsulatum DSM 1112]|uniref:Aspartyl-tRNA(Asn)/glutamyl-tRNA(Gln) amidotransferase subunit A n=1 Tax=Pararhizobium capsulatum DSM 1112 TaxID=1121113 RepID=A0ABU0BZW9_9HYPH|nr:amidase [Pararhizobium capsulatum]MDQ0323244.1 aspartyl-tRNA(Asn)/glutamyl-tRNA(Gln) amidotransferase subunit A [Pararhizobium capsulatum DSM 1112]